MSPESEPQKIDWSAIGFVALMIVIVVALFFGAVGLGIAWLGSRM